MTAIYEIQNAPTVEDYLRALTALGDRVTADHRTLFRVHYDAPARTATTRQLASWAGITGGFTVVNSLYRKLGHAICDELQIEPELRPDATHRWWSVWSRGWTTSAGYVWHMLPHFAEALEQLGWVSVDGFLLPDEVPGKSLVEGASSQILVNAYERSSEARRQCIAEYGPNCRVCGFNFGEVYGAEAEGYIHVHHIRPLSEINHEYVVDPIQDLRPVCPNCHAMLHLNGRCRSIEEVQLLLGQPKET